MKSTTQAMLVMPIASRQAFGASLPSAAFVRALTAGDSEAAVNLGVLSLLEEDVALADYVLSDGGRLPRLLRGMLDELEKELGK